MRSVTGGIGHAVSISMPFPDDRHSNYTRALTGTDESFPGTISSAA
jgi:hypothetical protein